jgi:hypothetical protein
MFWWGSSATAVRNWRKALGVTRSDNEGTARLIRASAEKGAEAVAGREWTAAERDRRRQVNAEQGLARNLVPGYRGEWWTPQDIALLGTAPDKEVARRTGRTAAAVRRKRWALAIPNPAGDRWTAEGIALLGTLPDREVARMLGRSLQSVTLKRIKLGIANSFDRRERDGR